MDSNVYFAARRCFYTDGETFITCIRLGTSEKLKITEANLLKVGVTLGSFFSATVSNDRKIRDLKATELADRPEIRKEGNFAHVNNVDAELVGSDGNLKFKTAIFGMIRSNDQSLPLGKYRISFRLSRSTEISAAHTEFLIVSTEPTVSPIAPEDPFVHSTFTTNIPSAPNDFQFKPLPNAEDFLADFRRMTLAAVLSPSPRPDSGLPELPSVPFRADAPAKNPVERRFKGDGFEVAVPERPKKNMRAFVMFSIDYEHLTCFHVWICDVDVQQHSTFKSTKHALDRGHFFEGLFMQMDDGYWSCVKYQKPAPPLFKGSIVSGRVELIGTVQAYQTPNGEQQYPQVLVNYLGPVIDRNHKLPVNCVGRKIKIQSIKLRPQSSRWCVIDVV